MGWLPLVGSLKLYVSFAKEPYKRDDILPKRPIILRRLLIVATPYQISMSLAVFVGKSPICMEKSPIAEKSFICMEKRPIDAGLFCKRVASAW